MNPRANQMNWPQEKSALLRQLLLDQIAERHRLARILHDEIAQSLASACFAREHWWQLHGDTCENPECRETNEILGQILLDLSHTTRDLMAELRPPLLSEFGLAKALRNELGQQQKRHPERRFDYVWQEGSNERRFDGTVEHALFIIVCEALQHALHHAEAKNLGIAGEWREDTITLCVHDDGNGMPSDHSPGAGLRLISMQERARAIDAKINYHHVQRTGTKLFISWPAPDAAPAHRR